MVRPKTVKILILYWTTYIEYGCLELRPDAYDGMNVAAPNHKQYNYRVDSPGGETYGSNFTKWYLSLRIVLRYRKKMKFVEQPTRAAPDPKTADPDTIDKYYKTINIEQEVACLMLSSMSPDLQRT
ncbi:hypothetical protein Tco_0287072 [Tanacetum coccineum]